MSSTNNSTSSAREAWDLDSMLAQEIQELNRDSPEDRRVKEAVIVSKTDPNKIEPDDSSSDDEYEDDLSIRDPELFKITESNKRIPLDENAKDPVKVLTRRPPELTFSDPPILVSREDYVEVTFHYGVSAEHKVLKPKRYMIMADFGEESSFALTWGIGTLLRNGDELHVASVVDIDEDVKDMSSDEKKKLWRDLDRNSKQLVSRVKSVLVTMLLYNLKVVIYSVAGKTRDSLLKLIYDTPNLTMVVCGSRDRGALKGMIMGSVSTFLVHNSPIPVSVVRPQKREKTKKQKNTAAKKLSQSVKSGSLKVDEAENRSINSYDGSSA